MRSDTVGSYTRHGRSLQRSVAQPAYPAKRPPIARAGGSSFKLQQAARGVELAKIVAGVRAGGPNSIR